MAKNIKEFVSNKIVNYLKKEDTSKILESVGCLEISFSELKVFGHNLEYVLNGRKRLALIAWLTYYFNFPEVPDFFDETQDFECQYDGDYIIVSFVLHCAYIQLDFFTKVNQNTGESFCYFDDLTYSSTTNENGEYFRWNVNNEGYDPDHIKTENLVKRFSDPSSYCDNIKKDVEFLRNMLTDNLDEAQERIGRPSKLL